MFRTVPLSIIRSLAMYTQQWYMSYKFAYNKPVCQVKKKTWLGILENRVLEKVFGSKAEEERGGWRK